VTAPIGAVVNSFGPVRAVENVRIQQVHGKQLVKQPMCKSLNEILSKLMISDSQRGLCIKWSISDNIPAS
jgi:hypothetical protein